MAETRKTNWKLFINESIVLVLHLTLAVFFCRISITALELYHAQLPAVAAGITSLCFLFPLLVHLIDLWARLLAAVREEPFAVRLLNFSIEWHRRLFGKNNAWMSEKEAILAHVYFDWDKKEEARPHFEEAWKQFEKARTKFPPLHPAMQNYLTLLDSDGEEDKVQQITKALRISNNWTLAQRGAAFLATIPSIVFIISIHSIELEISAKNSEMHAIDSLKGINALSKLETAVLGQYAGVLVFADYASAFEDANQFAEMTWCVNKAIEILQTSPEPDPLLTLSLLNQKALGLILTNKTSEARKGLLAALKLSYTLSDSKLTAGSWSRKYKIDKERDKAELHLAELERLEGNYSEAEELYLKACHLRSDLSWDSSSFDSYKKNDGSQDQQSPSSSKIKYASKVVDTIQLIDKLHKLQHIESKLNQPAKTLEIQKRICELLDRGYSLDQLDGRSTTETDFGVREAARELDVCSLMLADAGKKEASLEYLKKADALRNKNGRTLKLNASQQDSLVDICTTVTNGLLAAKYRSDDWQTKMGSLLKGELSSKGAQSSLARLPWYDNESLKKDSPQKSKIGKIEINFSPFCIRNSPSGSGIAVDVQGSVKIYSRAKAASSEEQKFNFAYLVKDVSKDKPAKAVIDGFLDNQPITSFQLD